MARDLSAATAGFPFAAQAARVHRHRLQPDGTAKTETLALLTSRPAAQLAPDHWLTANIAHWTIETGLHARLDASRHDDRCRLRRKHAVWVHGMFTRWANSLFIHWRQRRPDSRHLTTADFSAHFAADHDRRAISALTSISFPS